MLGNTVRWNRIRYNLYAPFYDWIDRFVVRERARSIGYLNLQPGESILVVGAGTGLDIPFFPVDVSVTAIDISPAMLERARTRAETLARNIRFFVMDAGHLDFPSETFDAIVLHLILAVVPDPEQTSREAARVLKRNGRAVVFDKFLPDRRSVSRLRRWAGRLTTILFSDINRKLSPILQAGGFHVVKNEPSLLGGFFRIAVIERMPEVVEKEIQT